MRFVIVLLLMAAVCSPVLAQKKKASQNQKNGSEPSFVYDPGDKTISATMLDNELSYEPGNAPAPDGFWLTWLEFVPGKGDILWVALKSGDTWKYRTQIAAPGAFARPTLTTDATGKLWLSYETDAGGQWDVVVREHEGEGKFGEAQKVSRGTGADINHKVVASPNGGLWIVWQSDQHGQFEVLACHLNGKPSEPATVSNNPLGDWQPSATVTLSGDLFVTWDTYDGESYNVAIRRLREGKWSNISVVAGTSRFEGRADISADTSGRVFLTWEEDGPNWGKYYTARTAGDKTSTKLGDDVGPVHRFRELQFVELDRETLRIKQSFHLPQPSLHLAAQRPNRPDHVKYIGAFYERAQLVIDGQSRPWIVYRHYYTPWMGIEPMHHVADDWGIYARCLLANGWSELFKFDIGQGDGMQRLSISPRDNGFTAVWATGRTDRKDLSKRSRGIAVADVRLAKEASSSVNVSSDAIPPTAGQTKQSATRKRPTTELGGRKMQLFFGDLHRHTDLSLCYTPSDGTIEDAYRYAIDAAPLDFLGITDHTHDLEMGKPLSHVWWRALKETDRHQLQGAFVTFYSYERSRGDTDHNVISLRRDMMRPHTYPLADFWRELDSDTFTIPHEPFNRVLWNHKDNAHRPLLEMYQGYRNTSGEDAAAEGLLKGHEVGFIASSDHLSTSASFAAVWADRPTRESLFRSLQARRTYGATAKIVLKVTCGDHWMGEKFETKSLPPIRIEATPTAKVEKLDLFLDGQVVSTITNISAGEPFAYEWKAEKSLSGPHIFHIRITQSDGHRAWSSPVWADIGK